MKFRKTAIFTACLLMCSSVNMLTSKADDVRMCEVTLIGDANDSGEVEVADLVKLSQYIMSADKEISMNADLNGDGSIDAFDMVLMRKMLLGNYIPEDYTKLTVNEICASNKKCLTSADGSAPDWVEIYNGSDTDINLGGYGISDGTKKMFKYAFPDDTIIKAGEYLVVLCDGDGVVTAGDGEHIAPFNISAKKSETVYLTHPYNGTINALTIPEGMETDVTYGRIPDGSENISYLTPTPGSANIKSDDLVYVSEPVFSVEGGFYDNSFDLELTAENCEIIYTLDGSDPRTSNTAKSYNESISVYNNTSEPNVWSAIKDVTLYDYYGPFSSVEKGIVVRAVAKDSEGNYSRVISNSYFISKGASYYKNMKVISITTDGDYFFDQDNGIYVVGTQYYNWRNSPDFDWRMDPGDSNNPTNYNSHGKEWEVPAAIQIFENGSAAYSANVGVRINGNWSRAQAQKSLRFYARSEYGTSKLDYEFIPDLTDVNGKKIDSFDKILLHNGGNDFGNLYMRDVLVEELCDDRDVDRGGYEPCVAFFNGEFWGFYNIRERTDEHFFQSHYNVDKANVTYIKNWEVEGLQELGDEFNELCKWAATADMKDEANYSIVANSIELGSFMDMIAIETYVNNNDFAGSGLNNYQLWRTNTVEEGNPYGDGRWRFMLNDLDMCCNLYMSEKTAPNYDLLNNMYTKAEAYNFISMFYNLLNNDGFRSEFEARYREIMNNNFNTERVIAAADAYASRCRDAINATNNRFGIMWNDYNGGLDMFKSYFRERPSYAETYLERLLSKYENR